MVADDRYQIVSRDLGHALFKQIRPHVETLERKRHVVRDFRTEHQLVTESFQMNAQYLGQLEDLGELDAIPQLIAFFATVHIVALELVGAKKCGETVMQTDHWSPEPRTHPLQEPRQPARLISHINHIRARSGFLRRQRTLMQHVDVISTRYGQGQILEGLHPGGNPIARQALHATHKLAVECVANDATRLHLLLGAMLGRRVLR